MFGTDLSRPILLFPSGERHHGHRHVCLHGGRNERLGQHPLPRKVRLPTTAIASPHRQTASHHVEPCPFCGAAPWRTGAATCWRWSGSGWPCWRPFSSSTRRSKLLSRYSCFACLQPPLLPSAENKRREIADSGQTLKLCSSSGSLPFSSPLS